MTIIINFLVHVVCFKIEKPFFVFSLFYYGNLYPLILLKLFVRKRRFIETQDECLKRDIIYESRLQATIRFIINDFYPSLTIESPRELRRVRDLVLAID